MPLAPDPFGLLNWIALEPTNGGAVARWFKAESRHEAACWTLTTGYVPAPTILTLDRVSHRFASPVETLFKSPRQGAGHFRSLLHAPKSTPDDQEWGIWARGGRRRAK